MSILTVGDDIVDVWALGTIAGNLTAGDNIYEVVTWDDMAAFLTAGGSCSTAPADDDPCGHIVHVRAWNDIVGGMTAESSIGTGWLNGGDDAPEFTGIYAGQTIAPSASLSAPVVGSVYEYNRTLFIEYPRAAVVPDGELVALTADAYARVLDLEQQFQEAVTEIQAVADATRVANSDWEWETYVLLTDLEAEAMAHFEEVSDQFDDAMEKADVLAKRAWEVAKIYVEGYQRQAHAAANEAEQAIAKQLHALTGEVEAQELANETEVAFLKETAAGVKAVQFKRDAAATQQMDGILSTRDALFVGVFFSELEELALDTLQGALEVCGIVGDLLPPLGIACDVVNAGLYAARGKYLDAGISVVSVVPVLGTVAAQGMKVGKPVLKSGLRKAGHLLGIGANAVQVAARGFSKYTRAIPVGKAAAVLRCKLGYLIGKGGCFVIQTPVISPHDAGGTWYASGGLTLAGTAIAAAAVAPKRRRKRKGELHDACFTANDPLSWDVEDDFMFDHKSIDPTHIGDDFEDLEQRRLDALCDLLFEGADHSASDRHFDRSDVGCGAAAPTVNGFHSGASRSSTHPATTAPSLCEPSTQISPDTPWRVSSGSLSLRERVGVRAPTTKPATRQTQATQHSSTLRSRLSLGTLFTGLLLAAFCFFKGASAPIESTRPIEDIRPGHKVIVDAPEEALATDVARLNGFESSWNASDGKLEIEGIADPRRELNEATPAQLEKADYRLVLLQAKEVWQDGTYNEINVATLQPWQWIHEHEVHVGSQAPLPLETVEMNLPVGMTGKVLDILPCPELERGAGRTVLTTVNRLARGVIELTLRDRDGNEETIRPTDEHLFYSASHGDWLPAGELQPGEHLDGVNGTITVASVTPLTGTHRVYNMTVQGEHLYRVAESGVLVHNQYPLFGTKGANTKIHHMVSYFKNSKRGFSSPWSQMSQDILKNAGLNPKHSRWNKIHLPNHKGPHPEIAHKLVYRRLQDATKHLTPHTIGYKEAVRVEMIKLANDILANPKAFGL